MKIYLVGGAVRDKLLGRPVVEKDWVVVGASPADLQSLGFRQVGRDFPVFLHPKTGEEYALARRERKTGLGYTGFAFDASPEVSLEEDLLRRDLTINAMAESQDGEIIDPFGGRQDLNARVLRHVSQAFAEDPVRILRVARFAARFGHLGFQVAAETEDLMRTMVVSGEVDALVAERVWKELERALKEPDPQLFFEVLAKADALSRLFPADILAGQPALQAAVHLTSDPSVRLAALLHVLSPEAIDSLSARFRLPNDFQQLAKLVAQTLPAYQTILQADAAEIVALLQTVDAFRREARFEKWLLACRACSVGHQQADYLYRSFQAAKSVDTATLAKEGQGLEIAARIYKARKQAVENAMKNKA